MTIRVLHVFAPNYKHRFGGPIYDWKFAFSRWDDPEIEHLVLDSENRRIQEANEAFQFEFTGEQYIATKWKRFTWIFFLLSYLSINKDKYDVVHIHVLWWATLLMGVWASWTDKPCIYQSVLLNEDTPGGLIKERFGKIKVWCLKKFKGIYTISDFLSSDYIIHGFQKEQVFTLMNPVDTELFRLCQTQEEKIALRKKYSIPASAIMLVFVGSVIARKGVDILVNAFIESCPGNRDLHLVIVGAKNKRENPSIDEDFINEQYMTLEREGCSNKVSFLGLIQDREKLAELYRASDMFVFPSRNEGLPNVVLEAMASGLPVIVSQLPVLEQVIEHGVNGLFVPVEDVHAFSQTILNLSETIELRENFGKNARSYAVNKHSFSAWQHQITAFYKKLIS